MKKELGMDVKKLRAYSFDLVRSTLRIVKPWKKTAYGVDGIHATELNTQRYVDGWNDCIKEVAKNGKNLIKKMESLP